VYDDRMSEDPTEGRRIYAVGDIHGRHDLLTDMLARIRADLAARPHRHPFVVFLGDYVDRGPDSRGVIETLIGFQAGDIPAAFLLGNHDRYLQTYLDDPDWYDLRFHWLAENLGGSRTLASYGVLDADPARPAATRDAFAAALPASHRGFLDAANLLVRSGAYVFAHAGIRPGVALDAQDPEDLIWIREPFLTSTVDFGFKVVHGHTIAKAVEHHPNRIAVDTGAFRTGVLSCIVLEGADVALLAPGGPTPWPVGAGLARWRGLWIRR
jgi:serine/threonine protein phosphatase 1